MASCSEECSPSAERSLQGFTTCFPKEVTGGLYVHYGCAGHLNLFTGLSNWTKRLVAHPRGRSICFSSGQSGSCAGTQSTVNILWGPAKILLLVAGKNWKSENQVDWT